VNFDDDGITETRHHNAANEIVSRVNDCSLKAVEYDAAGNLTKLERETDAGTQVLTLAYDYRNRLISVAADGVKTAEYFYDPLNRRVKKHLTSGDDVVYLYDGWQCIEERRLDEDVWATDREHIYGGQYIDEIAATCDSSSYHTTRSSRSFLLSQSGIQTESKR